jgi:hypothetical protein
VSDARIAELTGFSSVESALDVVREVTRARNAVFDATNRASGVDVSPNLDAYVAAVQGDPGEYSRLFAIDRVEFTAMHDASRSVLEAWGTADLTEDDQAAYEQLLGDELRWGPVEGLPLVRAYLYLSAYMLEQGVTDRLPEPPSSFSCPDEAMDPTTRANTLTPMGFLVSVSREQAACGVYDEYRAETELWPNYQQVAPAFARWSELISRGNREVIDAYADRTSAKPTDGSSAGDGVDGEIRSSRVFSEAVELISALGAACQGEPTSSPVAFDFFGLDQDSPGFRCETREGTAAVTVLPERDGLLVAGLLLHYVTVGNQVIVGPSDSPDEVWVASVPEGLSSMLLG